MHMYIKKKKIHGPWKRVTYEFACDANRWNWNFNLSKNNSFFLCLVFIVVNIVEFFLAAMQPFSSSLDVSVVLKALHSVSSYTIYTHVWFNAFCKIDYRPWTSWDVWCIMGSRWQSYSPFSRRKRKKKKKKKEKQKIRIQRITNQIYIAICMPAAGTLFSIQSSHLDGRYEITRNEPPITSIQCAYISKYSKR